LNRFDTVVLTKDTQQNYPGVERSRQCYHMRQYVFGEPRTIQRDENRIEYDLLLLPALEVG
jgi:hypothetical protein